MQYKSKWFDKDKFEKEIVLLCLESFTNNLEEAIMPRRKNKPNNFRGKEDIFFTKVRNGLKKFLESPFK